MSRLAVTKDAIVKDATEFRIVQDGVVKDVVRALVVHNGQTCQFWPRTDFSTEEVVWTPSPLTALDIQTDPLDAQAAIQFLLADGNAYLDNTPPGGSIVAPYVTPPINATGKLLLRWNTVTGTLASNVTENVWFDMFSNGGAFIASVFLDQTIPGALLASADIDIADDTGGGVPGTIVTKRVSFHAEVTHATDVLMSTLQWDLEHETVNADALTTISLSPDGVLRGWEGPALVLQENYAITGVDTALFTAQLDVISGDNPSGSPLGAPQTLDVAASWNLATVADLEDFAGEYDLTVVGPSETVVKRVTMHVSRTDDFSADLVWTTVATLMLEGNVVNGSTVTLDHDINGTSDLTVAGIPDPGGWPQNWHANAPTPADPEGYEVNMRTVSGTPPSGSALDTWLPGDSAYQWVWTKAAPNLIGAVDWSYRRLGQPSTEVKKRISVTLSGGDPI